MVSLSKKVDYALISLAHLIQNPDRVASAREIAQTHGLPLPLLMNILKRMHHAGVLGSARGVKGGYRIAMNLDRLSLARLIEMVETTGGEQQHLPRKLSVQPAMQALQYKLAGLLDEVKVTDLVKPGRRIDVPLQRLRIAERTGFTEMASTA